MLPNLRKSITILCLIISITQLFSQQNFWQPQKLEEYNQRQSRNENNLPNSYQLFRLSFSDIKTELLKTSLSKNLNSIKDSRISLLIPMPDGSFEDFYIAEDPILSNETAILLPNVKTYEGQSMKNPNLYIRFTISPLGFNGIIVGHENGRIYLSPYNFGENEIHIINYEKDEKQEFNNTKCGQNSSIDNSVDEIKEVLKNSGQRAGDCQLRTYKMAVASTGEYTQAAGSQASAQAQITSTINNIITTFKKELSITFTLVLENSITFPDPVTDPYPTITTGPDAAYLSTNHTTLVSNLSGGSAAFDLGHVFHKGWGAAGLCTGCGSWQGLAGVSVVCDGSNKGRAASGGEVGGSSAPPMGPNFEGVVAHEIGHQFSALHTQSLTSCQFSNNGYEIVAGSTLMGYGTSCTINYNAKDYYMHARTLSQISTFMISSTCASISSTGNSAPTVTVASNNYSIPAGSYFELTSTGNDTNGDAITYNWEQYDIGSMSTWPTSTAINGPTYRSFPSSTSPKRTFPNIQKLLTNTLTNSGEVVPTVERNLKFRCTVRDNAISGGCSSEVDVDITLNSTAPLNITSFNSSTSWFVGDSKTITWDAGGSTSSGNCSNVNILYTINNGATWTTWISNTANDGTENLTVPNELTNTFRFKIECVRDATLTIFDVNNANITILATCAPPASTVTPNAPITATEGNSALIFVHLEIFGALGTETEQQQIVIQHQMIAVLNTTNNSCQAFGTNPNYHTYKFRVSSSGSVQ
ncbi:MAG: hypothetical protein IPL95_14620 [Saprospiraceae bacterium]|nr:hypothetical protein [Saprospiraceae bacterium]